MSERACKAKDVCTRVVKCLEINDISVKNEIDASSVKSNSNDHTIADNVNIRIYHIFSNDEYTLAVRHCEFADRDWTVWINNITIKHLSAS